VMDTLSLTNQPWGVRFSPTDEELFQRYLRLKNSGNEEEVGFIRFIREVNFFKREPWELPGDQFSIRFEDLIFLFWNFNFFLGNFLNFFVCS
jgi:hypothetical protein